MKKNSLKETSVVHRTGFLPMRLYRHVRFVSYHWHDEYEILRVRSGQATCVIDGKNVVLSGGHAALIRGGELHNVFPSVEPLDSFAVVFHPYLIYGSDSARLPQQTPHFRTVLTDPEILDALDRIYDAYEKKDLGYEIVIKASILEIFRVLYEKKYYTESEESEPLASEAFLNMADYIHVNYASPITLDQLCALSHYSKSYISLLFRHHTGKTPMEYVNDYRVSQATLLLSASDRSVTQIAMDCGFDSVGWFIREFRSRVGETPLRYRKNKAL